MNLKPFSALAICAFLSLAVCAATQAQVRPGAPVTLGSPVTRAGQASPTANGAQHEACWRKAGISQAAVAQHRAIAEQTRAQVESVCRDSALSPQQKHQQIQEIRQSARQHEQGLVTPQEYSAFESCRHGAAAAGGGGHMGGMHAGGGDPCGHL